MIKRHIFTEPVNTDTIICNWCGAGITLTSPQDNIATFITEHTNCNKPENTDLAFLAVDLEYVP